MRFVNAPAVRNAVMDSKIVRWEIDNETDMLGWCGNCEPWSEIRFVSVTTSGYDIDGKRIALIVTEICSECGDERIVMHADYSGGR